MASVMPISYSRKAIYGRGVIPTSNTFLRSPARVHLTLMEVEG